MAEKPTLFVCHGDEGSPACLRKGSRDELRAATGSEKLPALKLSDGTVITSSRAIIAWAREQG